MQQYFQNDQRNYLFVLSVINYTDISRRKTYIFVSKTEEEIKKIRISNKENNEQIYEAKENNEHIYLINEKDEV